MTPVPNAIMVYNTNHALTSLQNVIDSMVNTNLPELRGTETYINFMGKFLREPNIQEIGKFYDRRDDTYSW